jgi:acetyl-CoA synthetase
MGLDFVILDSATDHNQAAERVDHQQQADQGEVYLIPPSIGLSQTLSNADHDAAYYQGCPTWRGKQLRRHGDQLQRLPGGWYRVAGRTDDTMNLGGIKVSSAELERCFAADPAVRESAAVAVADEQGGPNQLVVFIVPATEADSPTAASLRETLQRRLSSQINPLFRIGRVVLVETLPRTASNKVMRRVLREQAQEALSRGDR